jgi:rhodanese-related sulfurtransferase
MVTIDELLESARARLDRVTADRLEAEMAAGALLVDIRPIDRRRRAGELPGAMVIDRNELEWRLCPSSDSRGVDVEPDQKVIVVCNDGYQSSLAAAILQDLGVPGATDLVGGYNAWRTANPTD